MKIIGAEGLSQEQLAVKLTEGYRLVSYRYCISIIILTFRRSSNLYLLAPGQSGKAFPFAMLSFFLGWWGIPWGPIYTISSIVNAMRGGTDHTHDYLQGIAAELNITIPTAVTKELQTQEVEQKTPGLAIASLILSILSLLLLGPLTSIPGVTCGHMALHKIKRHNIKKGRPMAIAGLIIGYLSIVSTICFVIYLVSAPEFQEGLQQIDAQ